MDRNNKAVKQLAKDNGSLSARRAWIEILLALVVWPGLLAVALRKESVDRNLFGQAKEKPYLESLSARRAWIEICPTCQWRRSVKRRSPQGERG